MANATYDPASVVGTFLKTHAIPQETFAGLIGLSTGAVSEFLNAKKNLPGDVAERWLSTIKVMKEFIERTAPLHLNWHPRCAESWKKILQDFERRQLLISVVSLKSDSTDSPEVIRAAQELAGALETLGKRTDI
jgi:hypothetical protein